ncbi:MAG TPA: IS5 family transposase [Roseiarcus sp.]
MWTNENRARYDRSRLRYPSDLTDAEWAHVEPLIPPAKRGGNRRHVDVREVVNGLMYILSTGCQWRAIPKDLPPRSTLHDYFDLWSWDGTLERIHAALYAKCREAAAREASPTAAIIPGSKSPGTSQSVKSAEKGGPRIDPSGYDAGKKINGKKRHILVDTQGLLMHAIVHAADVQDRDGGALVMATLFGAFPFLTRLFADGGYQGPQFKSAIRRTLAAVTVEIVKRSDQVKTFVPLPKRWIGERTLAWLGRCRRLAKDWECLNHKALAFLRLASIRFMLRKLCNPT